jgi:hypothetical protein
MTFEATREHGNKDSDMTIRGPHVHGAGDPDRDSIGEAALMLEQDMDNYVSMIASDPSVFKESMLFGIESGESIRVTLVGSATCAYELLEEATNRQVTKEYEVVALVSNGWVEATKHNDGEESSAVTGPERVRMTLLSGKGNTCTVMRFADNEVLFHEGAGSGPLTDALAEFWASSAN